MRGNRGGTHRAASLQRATSAEHDRVIDLVRAGAILGVVVGHWLVDEFYLSDGEILERSNLSQVPGMWPLTWLFMVLPLFFFVGGWSNRRSWESVRRGGRGYGNFLARRVHRLLTPTLLYIGVLFAVAILVRLRPDLVGGRVTAQTAALATQPLWFLGIYLAVVALTPVTLAAHHRWGWGAVAVLAAVVVAIDVIRFGLGWEMFGLLNVLGVWVLVHQLGYLDADGRLSGRVGVALAVGGYGMLCLLVALGPYPARMVGVPEDTWSNAHPPNLAMAALAAGQIGVVELLRPRLARGLQRPRLWLVVVVVNTVIMSLYLWHQVARMIASAVLLPLGYPVPAPATLRWWAATIGMILVSGVILALIAVIVRPAEQRPPPADMPPQGWRSVVAAAAIVSAALGMMMLAGTTVTRLAEFTPVLGSLQASPALGVLLILVAVGLLRVAGRARGGGG